MKIIYIIWYICMYVCLCISFSALNGIKGYLQCLVLNVSLSRSRISWEINLWEHVWGIVWMIIIDVGRHILTVGSIHSLGRRSQIILNMKVIWIQGWMCSSISVSWLTRMWAAVSGPCCFEIPAMVDCTLNCELN